MIETLKGLVWCRQPHPIRKVFVTALLALSFAAQPPTAVAQTPTLDVNAGVARKDISPEIYGILGGVSPFGLTQALATQLKVPEVRFGGDYATKYNWTFNSTNNGADYFFLSGTSSGTATPGANLDNMISNFRKAYSGVKILGTIPTIPYINGSALPLCSYPVSVYGIQQSSTMWGGQSCGNGMTSGGAKISD